MLKYSTDTFSNRIPKVISEASTDSINLLMVKLWLLLPSQSHYYYLIAGLEIVGIYRLPAANPIII